MSIADNVRTRRLARRLTQTELANRARVAQALISQIEGGADNVRMETLRSLAAALGCTAVDLLPAADKQRRSRA